MTTRARFALLTAAAVTFVPLLFFALLKLNSQYDSVHVAPHAHFWVVSGAALPAAVIAVAVGIAGNRVRNIHVTFVSLAFTSLAIIFLLHGLATPGLLLPVTPIPGITSQLSVLLTTAWLCMSALPSDLPLSQCLTRWQRWLVPVWAVLMLAVLAVGMLWPTAAVWQWLDSDVAMWTVTAAVLVMSVITARHYLIAYRYSHFPLQFWLLCSTGWLAGAQIIMVTGEVWRASWWTYHFLLLAAVISVVYGLVKQYTLGTSLGAAIRGLMTDDPYERVEAGISPSIRALVIATETHDHYTAGHGYRVAVEALRIGQAMGLRPEQLRALAQGGIVHDIGKMDIPAHILNKPGRLTDAERAIVEQHPVRGYEVCKRVGFMPDELGIIRHHHEKWDGTGYPDGLRGEEIPLLARVLAIADVYDALTSERSYRQPWSHERAVAYIVEQAGVHFDPACVEAWLRVAEAAPQAHRYPFWLRPREVTAG